ncbi:hypothetical protein Tco_1445802 [Tanacetum coccineum]
MTGGLLRGTSKDNIGATPVGITGNVFGSTSGGPPEINAETLLDGATPSAREQIEGHLSASVGDVDLKKPFKEAVKTPLTQRIIEFVGPEFKMPANIKLYDETTDPEDHLSRFSTDLASGPCLCGAVCSNRLWMGAREGGSKTSRTEALMDGQYSDSTFKERCIVETGFITGVPEVMKISSFMDAHKCPELAKRFADKVPKTVDEMMMGLDDFVRSEEAFASTELPKGEVSEASKRSMVRLVGRKNGSIEEGMEADRRRKTGVQNFKHRGGLSAIFMICPLPSKTIRPAASLDSTSARSLSYPRKISYGISAKPTAT